MRGRASGLGARISSMALLIFVGNWLVGRAVGEVHWADYLLDERNFVLSSAILFVEQIVCPWFCPLLSWNEGVDPARGIVRRLVQENQKARQPTGEIGQGAFGLGFRVEWANAQIRLRTDAARLADERCADNLVGISVFIPRAWSGEADEDLPFVDEI